MHNAYPIVIVSPGLALSQTHAFSTYDPPIAAEIRYSPYDQKSSGGAAILPVPTAVVPLVVFSVTMQFAQGPSAQVNIRSDTSVFREQTVGILSRRHSHHVARLATILL